MCRRFIRRNLMSVQTFNTTLFSRHFQEFYWNLKTCYRRHHVLSKSRKISQQNASNSGKYSTSEYFLTLFSRQLKNNLALRSLWLTTCCLIIFPIFQWTKIYFPSAAILSGRSLIKYCSLLSLNLSHNLNVIRVSVPCGNYHRNNWIMTLSAAFLISHRRFVCSRILNSTHDVFKPIKPNASYEYKNAWLMCLFQRVLLQRRERFLFGIKSACRKSDRHADDSLECAPDRKPNFATALSATFRRHCHAIFFRLENLRLTDKLIFQFCAGYRLNQSLKFPSRGSQHKEA